MLEKIKNHAQLGHFVSYCATLLLYGMLITGLGPLIPYFSEKTGIIQTEYSFVFSCRSFGMLGGALLHKLLKKHINISHHSFLIWSTLVIIVGSILFSWTISLPSQGLWMILASIGYGMFQIEGNTCILMTSPKDDAQFWLLLGHGFFGVGGLIGPLVIYTFQTNSFVVIAVLFIFTIPTYYFLSPPEYQNTQQKQGDNKHNKKITPRKVEFLLCIALFIYIGMETTYGGWISSFSILSGFSTKQNATLYPSIFWITITVFRFILAVFQGSTSKKMKVLLYGVILSGILSLFLIHLGYGHFTCYFSAIIFGISMSSLFAQVLTISSEFGFTLAEYQTGNIVTCSVVGQGFLTMLVGVAMEEIHINMLFYGLILMGFSMEIIRRLCIKYFQQAEFQRKQNEFQLLDKSTPL